MIDPPVGTRHRLCQQHFLLVSPPDEDIVQQVPVSRPRVHPDRLLPHRQAGEGVGQDKMVFYASLSEEQAIATKALETTGPQQSSLDSMVCADAGVEVTRDN
nr:unnamed protein product [Spirometra erinaceieuropaei]